MYENPKCKCGEELEFDNDTDLWADGDVVTMVCLGHCVKCGKKYQWLDRYILSMYSALEERE